MASTLRTFARSTADRAVHLRSTPRPSSIGESREILRLISRFGEVEYFKNLKYDNLPTPNAAIVIFKDEEAARDCLVKSPIRFRLGRAEPTEDLMSVPQSMPPTPVDTSTFSTEAPAAPEPANNNKRPAKVAARAPFGLSQTRSLSTTSAALPDPPRKPPPMPFIDPLSPAPAEPESRIFQVTAGPARMHFRDRIDEGHYNGYFSVDTKSLIQQDLVKKMSTVGMSCVDWRKDARPWRVMTREKERERKGVERRRSLRELFDEGPGEVGGLERLGRKQSVLENRIG